MSTKTSKKWNSIKLGNVAKITRGSSPRPIADEKYFVGGNIPWIKIADATKSGKYLYETKEYVNAYGASFSRLLPKGSLIVAASGTLGYTQFLGVDGCVHDGWLIVDPEEDTVNKDFLYYKLIEQQKYFYNSAYGAAIQNVNTGILKELEIALPELAVQKRISNVLSTYDDLIDNNNRRIKILEDIAKKIYTEWFGDFRFPGYEKVKFGKDGLPEGWEIKKVEDVIKRISAGKKYENKTVEPTGAVPVLDQGKTGVIGYHNDEPGVVASVSNPVIVFANHTCYQNLIMFPFSAIQNVLPFVPVDERNIYWLHFATKDLISFNDYKGHWPEFMTKKLVVPSVEMTDRFGSQIQENIISKYKLGKMNESLKKSRDFLIPQLVTGNLEINI